MSVNECRNVIYICCRLTEYFLLRKMEFWGHVLLLSLSCITVLRAQNAPFNSFSYTCNQTLLHLAVKIDPLGNGLTLDPSQISLGTCHPATTVYIEHYFATVKLPDCGVTTVTYGNSIMYTIPLAYHPSNNPKYQYQWDFEEALTCAYNRTLDPALQLPGPVTSQLSGEGSLIFSADIMKDDFSGPSNFKEFYLGSQIPVEISVSTGQHQPMLIYVEECIAATALDLQSAFQTYSLIQNHGCFVDGKETASTFKKRVSPGSIRLAIEALRFIGLNTDIYLHFKVAVWDPKAQNDVTKKACSYLREINRWELLDDPNLSSLCSCCDSTCISSSRKRRDANGAEEDAALVHKMVLGPFKINGKDWNGNVSKTVYTTSVQELMGQQQELGNYFLTSPPYL
uniref:ZP domain-containing protein n=1 Tax=Leptobrachium leishanense TaxID=445787 RepID=A0A8C5PGX8_9ANUR